MKLPPQNPSDKIAFGDNLKRSSLRDQGIKITITAAIIWYITLCLINLLSLRPLWNDENCVFLSIQSYTPHEMFHRVLHAYQVFPRGYLFLIQQVSKPFNFHLLSLRILPFICMMTAFFLWLKLASYAIKNKVTLLNFVLCWSASVVLIYYSGELKQYSMDVLTGILFILTLYHQEKLGRQENHSQYRLVLLFLPTLIFFSYIAYFFILFPLYNLFLSFLRKDKNTKPFLLVYITSLSVCVVISYFFDLRLRPIEAVTQGFQDYFISYQSFPEFLKTLTEGIHNLFSRWFVERPKILKAIGLFFTTLGFLKMFYSFRKNWKEDNYQLRRVETIALVVFIELFLAGALHKYPFSIPRTSLFFCPVILWLTVRAIEDLKKWNVIVYRCIYGGFVYFLVFVSICLSFFILNRILDFRPILWQ